MVKGYYGADMLAEQVIAGILLSDGIPDKILDIEIHVIETENEEGEPFKLVTFACPVNERKDLVVEVAFYDWGYSIISWRLHNTTEWVPFNEVTIFGGFQ
jgi:hypothetical protein